MKDFIFGKSKKYRVQTEVGVFDIGGRSYSYRKSILTIKDGFSKVATFLNIKHIVEV